MVDLLRAARPDEAAALSRLALRSKAHWGYDDAFMAACRDELTVTPELIEEAVVRLIERSGRIAGFYALVPGEGEGGVTEVRRGEIEWFYVAPEQIGRGCGKALWVDLVTRAEALGYRFLLVESDPHAEGFYRAMGAIRIGDAASGSIPDRRLPKLRVELSGAATAGPGG